jgi:iron complex transport system permease protein
VTVATAQAPVRSDRGRRPLLVGSLVAVIVAAALIGLCIGTPPLGLDQVAAILVGGDGSRLERLVVMELRVPRVVLGTMAGAAFGVAGALLQATLRNPLAGPELLGVSAGAAAVMAAIIVLHVPVALALHPIAAFFGALAGGALVLRLSRRARSPLEVALVGAAVAALLAALVIGIIGLASSSGDVQLFFLYAVGDLGDRTWSHVGLVAPWFAIAMPAALLLSRPVNLLQLGDELATGRGVPVTRVRTLVLVVGAALIAMVVAVCGPIAWIGLIAPHLARLATRSADVRVVAPIAGLMGAAVLLAADLVARLLFAPDELPVGMTTTLLAAPLLFLLLRRARLGWTPTGALEP